MSTIFVSFPYFIFVGTICISLYLYISTGDRRISEPSTVSLSDVQLIRLSGDSTAGLRPCVLQPVQATSVPWTTGVDG